MAEDKKANKKNELPHISLNTIDGTRLRGIGFAISEPNAKPMNDKEFINKINTIIDVASLKLNSKTNTYFLLELTLPYYNKDVSYVLNKLKLQLKSVLNDFRILVSTEQENLQSYVKGKIHKGVLKVIRDIKQLESSAKIGKSLQKIIREDIDRKKAINIMIRLLNYLDDEERTICLKDLSLLLNGQREIILHPRSLTISCVCSTAVINKVAESPFVKLVTESPKIEEIRPISNNDDTPILYQMEEVEFKEGISNLPPICVIDSGISPILDKFVVKKDLLYNFFSNNETIPHGTSVSSVAIFGEDLLDKKKVLESKTKVISLKIDDASISHEDINLEEAIMEAIKRYKSETNIFTTSYNYHEISDELRTEMIKRLDSFIQKENVILVNSAGNIPLDKCYLLNSSYPKYLTQHPVYAPAEARNIFSVGSICSTSTPENPVIANHTRIGIPPIYLDEELDKYIYFKPDIYTYGGNTVPNQLLRKNVVNNQLGFPVIAPNGSIILDCGTSYSAPLIALCFARLYGKFGNKLKNSETYKAILINQSKYSECNGFTTFSLLDTKNVGNCTDGIYLNFEGESEPHEKAENHKRTQIIKCKKIKFHIPLEADSIDAVVVHSNNYGEQEAKNFKTKVILKLKKPTGTALKKDYGNIGKNSAVTHARYKLGRNYAGDCEAELHIETTGIPKELFDKIKIRFGVSLRINIKEEHFSKLSELYEEINEKSLTNKKVQVVQFERPHAIQPAILIQNQSNVSQNQVEYNLG